MYKIVNTDSRYIDEDAVQELNALAGYDCSVSISIDEKNQDGHPFVCKITEGKNTRSANGKRPITALAKAIDEYIAAKRKEKEAINTKHLRKKKEGVGERRKRDQRDYFADDSILTK